VDNYLLRGKSAYELAIENGIITSDITEVEYSKMYLSKSNEWSSINW
jgi:hypothetical protein